MKSGLNPDRDELYCFVIGNYGNFNIGDEMLLKQVIKEVSNGSQVKPRFYVPARNMDFVKTYHQELLGRINPISSKDLKKIIAPSFKLQDNRSRRRRHLEW